MIPDDEITRLKKWLDKEIELRVFAGYSDQPESDFYALARHTLAERKLLAKEHDEASRLPMADETEPHEAAWQAVEDFK